MLGKWIGNWAALSAWVVWTAGAVFSLASSVAPQKPIRKARWGFGVEDLKTTLYEFGGSLFWTSSSLTCVLNAPVFRSLGNECTPWVHLSILFHPKRQCYLACSKMMLQYKPAPGWTGDSLQLMWTETLTHMHIVTPGINHLQNLNGKKN